MKQVPVKGKPGEVMFALVDDEEFKFVTVFHWKLKEARKWNDLEQKTFDAYTTHKDENGKWSSLFMHHLILPKKDGFWVRHTNGDRLDNRRANLEYIPAKPRPKPKQPYPTLISMDWWDEIFRKYEEYYEAMSNGIQLPDPLEEAMANSVPMTDDEFEQWEKEHEVTIDELAGDQRSGDGS